MGKEFELKYKASPEVLESIRKQFGVFTPIHMETHYYDTPEGALGAKRWTLRRRLENGVSICGLKTPGHNLVRGEWETENEDMEAGARELCRLDVPEGFEQMISGGLTEVCGARFTRLAFLAETADGTVEIALDQGVFLGRGKEKPFSELEVELKSGSRQAAEDFAQAIAEKYHLETETLSKYERALALARGV